MTNQTSANAPLKLNMKRTMIIGFAFFGILLLWQVYDSWCPTLLTELFAKAMYPDPVNGYMALMSVANDPMVTKEVALQAIANREAMAKQVQYIVGVMMAIDNLAALILLPIFGRLSDKTHTKWGKRMPYIAIGTLVCAIAFPFIPVIFHYAGSIVGVIVMMAIVVLFAMMYRNPAVALMPDMTPKPLRSKANGIINIMGYIGGLFATLVGMVFVLSEYLGTKVDAKTGLYAKHSWAYNNPWAIVMPFVIASILMVVSAVVLFIKIKENKVAEEVKDEMARGELEAEVVDKVSEEAPMSKQNRRMLIFILAAEFFWFMADNGIGTFFGNYTVYYLKASSMDAMINTIIFGVGSVVGFAFGGTIASKIGRKWTLFGGLGIALFAYVLWAILSFVPGAVVVGKFPVWLYIIFLLRGFGMSLVHVNSFPMVVELCPNSKIGQFTGYYYASSMAAQTVTPVLLGLLLYLPNFPFTYIPLYAVVCILIATLIFFFVKNVKNRKTNFASGIEALGEVDD